MKRTIHALSATSSVLVAVALAAAVVTACGNGDDSTPTPPDSGASDGAKTEGGDAARSDASGVGDAPGPETDAGASPDAGDATLASDASDAGDAGDASDAHDAADGAVACNFATFVKGLIANDTTRTALPSVDLGQTCVDDHNQADFQSLFP
ncbi:MAG: hypothetical protein WBY94_31360 [Polyangiaceae bacterium]